MELIAYIRLFRKWFWLLLLGAFLAAGAAYIVSSNQTELYTASVTVMVGGAVETPNPDYNELRISSELVETYAVLAKTYDILEATIQAGNFPVTEGQLRASLSTRVVSNTSLLVLTVSNSDPVLAADMANEIARQLILNSPTTLTPEQEQQVASQNAEISQLEQELQNARLNQQTLDAQIAAETDPAQLESLKDQRTELTDQIIQISGNIAQYRNNIAALQKRINSLDIVETARTPTAPIGAGTFSRVILGAMVGAALAAGVALLIEYIDDTFRAPEEVAQALGLPILAAITRFGKSRDDYPHRLITYQDPGAHASEEYRTLRTNLLFSTNGTANKGIYIVTSPGPSEGKSVTTANLAVTIAMAGWRVLLVDADLRRPKVHEVFGLENKVGLSTLLSADPSEFGNGQRSAQSLNECIQETDIPGLRVLTSGYLPLNPTEVLGSVSMQRWFQEFRSASNVDIVLFDTPPALVVADSAVLASAIEVPVVLVLEAGHTRRGAAVRTKEQLDQLGITISGVVLNAVNLKDTRGYGYGYSYYYYYGESNGKVPSSKERV